MEGPNTDSLRTLAPSWTLAGDDMLLTLLQNTHQRILSKCQDVNTKLDEMTSSLDDASIHLQNVNNKFMSLSNRQFIESRVYDDDVDLETQAQTKMEPTDQPPSLSDEINIIKNSLAILESRHETAEIIDDSDSDSDVEISVVLKPRDAYSDRPLPYIIGSLQWKNKWHAGLITETSDTDSIPSKGHSDVEYSDSEVEDIQTDRHHDNTISESSSLQSDQERGQERGPDRGRPQPTAAEVAANIASLMARTQPLIERPVTPPSPPQAPPARPPAVYKPTPPLTSRVFPDEPPPLEDSHQYTSSSSQEDIFAEINKNKPYNQGFKVQSGITEDLFGKKEKENVFGVPYDEGSSYFRDEPPSVKQKPPMEEQIESKSVEQSEKLRKENLAENNIKKPVGGISLFGSNKNTDTIGAAILKRNIRKSSTSDESGSDVPVTNQKQTNMADESRNIDETDNRKAERDIFDDLFAKSKAANNKNTKVNKKEQKTIVNTEKKQKKDLFSDNIFDDVDDIFSSDIKIPSKSDKPSLFDDDDDLFSDIAKTDTNISKNKDAKPQTVKTKLFDSDDELFSDIKTSKIDNDEKITSKTVHPIVTSKNDDSKENVLSNTAHASAQSEQTKSKTVQPITTNKVVENIPKPKAISIFDSDSDEDIFNFNKSAPKSSIENSSAKSKLKTEEINKFQSPSIFDDDEIDELFVNIENNKVDSKIDSIKVPAKGEFTTDKQEQKKNEIEPKIKTSVVIDPLLSENDKGKSALNVEIESSKSFETNTRSQGNDKLSADISNSEKTTFIPEAQGSKSINTSSTNNTTLDTNDVNILDERKALENEISLNANVEISDKLNPKSTNDQTKTTHPDNSKAKETLLPKPEVPIFDDIEPPPFEVTNEPIDNISKETSVFEDPIGNIIEETPETPIFDEKIENITRERTTIPILEDKVENISKEKPGLPIFDVQMENIAKEMPPEVPIFEAIVTEPPIFEKAKEPKKSKNVNALFDDDSEDEALFFKKNDVISDEKPDVFSNAANFGLFTDEPPPDDFENDLFGSTHAPDPISKDQFIESDPILKNQDIESNKIDQISIVTNKSAEKVNPNNDLSLKTEVSKSKPSQSLFENDSDEDLFSFNKASTSKKPEDSLFKNETNNKNKESKQMSKKTDTIDKQKSLFDNLDDNLFTTRTQHTENSTSDSNNTINKDIDTKKVGKLTTNLNINVQALVPGASPKKTKLEKVDTEPTLVKPIDTEPKMVKSISFEDEPERDVLDNNASKQRAKIQVKRRPSSRKARHEAVRKSAIDIDQNIKQDFEPQDLKSRTDFENRPKFDTKDIKKESSTEKLTISHEKLDKTNEYVDKTERNEIIIAKMNTDAISPDPTESITNENINKTQVAQSQNNIQNTENQKEKSTKVVYVLNDEDIFTNPIKTNTVTDVSAPTLQGNEMFAKHEGTSTKNVENTTKIEEDPLKVEETATKVEETATKVEETITKVEEKPKKISLFDSDEDEADSLFKTKPITKQSKNTKLFDSDSEDDLFSKKRPNVKEKDKMLKKSLFDDDDAGDDLFGAKPKAKSENKPKSSTSKAKVEENKEKSKTIFADPLSLFGDDDED